MKELPSIYKNVVNVHNNKETFYSENSNVQGQKISGKNDFSAIRSVEEVIQEIFKNRSYSYTKKVRVKSGGRVFETRFIRENNGEILTIDNEILNLSEIDALELVKE